MQGLFVLDYNRLLRRVRGNNERYEATAAVKQNLSDSDRLKLGLFKYPVPRKAYPAEEYADTSGIRELFGVHHWKCLVSDNDVMLFCGGHQTEYLINRLDRSWIIRDCKPFADYLWEMLQVTYDFSPRIDGNGKVQYPSTPDSEKEFRAFTTLYPDAIEKINRKWGHGLVLDSCEDFYKGPKPVDCTSKNLKRPSFDS